MTSADIFSIPPSGVGIFQWIIENKQQGCELEFFFPEAVILDPDCLKKKNLTLFILKAQRILHPNLNCLSPKSCKKAFFTIHYNHSVKLVKIWKNYENLVLLRSVLNSAQKKPQRHNVQCQKEIFALSETSILKQCRYTGTEVLQIHTVID